VELEVAEGRVVQEGGGEGGGIEAEVADGVGDADAVAVGAGEGGGVEFADGREAAEEGFGEAHAFFFREADDLEVVGHSLPCCARLLGHLLREGDAHDDAEYTVEGAGIGDGVEVRADEQAGGVGLCGGQEAA